MADVHRHGRAGIPDKAVVSMTFRIRQKALRKEPLQVVAVKYTVDILDIKT